MRNGRCSCGSPPGPPTRGCKPNFEGAPAKAPAGSYLEIRRHWKPGDEVTLQFDFALRAVAGANEAAGKVSLYRGPLLLAWDQAQTPFDEEKIPAVNLARLAEARVVAARRKPSQLNPGLAAVGVAHGEREHAAPGGFRQRRNRRHALSLVAARRQAASSSCLYPVSSRRRACATGARSCSNGMARATRRTSSIASKLPAIPDSPKRLFSTNLSARPRLVVDLAAPPSSPSPDRWWRVITVSANGETIPDLPPARFTLAADALSAGHPGG